MRTLGIVDSVGLPRPTVGCYYETTYISKLEKKGYFWLLSGGGYRLATRYEHLLNLSQYLEPNFFDLIVIQIGIVDCSPRPIPYLVRQVVSLGPSWLIKGVAQVLHILRPIILKKKFYQFTPIKKFTLLYGNLLKVTKRLGKTTIIIGIAPIKHSLEIHSPGTTTQIDLYNNSLKELAKTSDSYYVDLEGLSEEDLTDDAHIKGTAHTFILDRIEEILKR